MQNNSSFETSLRSPTPWPADAFPPLPTFFAALGAIAIAIGGAVLYITAYVAIGHHAGGRKNLPLTQLVTAQIVGYAFAYAYLLFTVPRLARRSLADLGVRTPALRDVVAGLLGAAAMLVGVVAASSLVVAVTHHEDTEAAMQLLRAVHSRSELILFVLATTVVAPLVEEFGFRVFFYNAVSRYSSIAVGAVISSIVFGLVHGSGPSVYLPLAVGGFALVSVYIATGNYFANVITHAAFNLAVLSAAIGHSAR